MKKKKKVSKKKVVRFIIIIIVLIALIGAIVIFSGRFTKKETKVKTVVNVVDTIKGYDYTLDDNETEYYKGLFQKLKEVLEADKVDEEKYATLVGQLFLADFFHLDNKITKNDIGGLQFVYDSFQSDFTKLAQSSIYHTVLSNIYGDRKQKLPKVVKVSVDNITSESYTYLEEKDEEAYQIDYSIEYEEDLGYQEKTTLVIVHHNDKLEIIKMTEE